MGVRYWIRLCLGITLVCAMPPAGAQPDPDILWKIVSNCLADNPGAACPSPRQRGPLPVEDTLRVCRGSTDVWGEAPGEFVVIRDYKMCNCTGDASFIHGLALPLTRTAGVEGPARPDGIWPFAWNVALEKIGRGNAAAIGLAINPRGMRSQNQMHIHIVRLREDYLRRLAAHPEYVKREVKVASLDQVWQQAPPPAAVDGGFDNFGLLVTAAEGGGYTVRVTSPNISPEGEFTQYLCPR